MANKLHWHLPIRAVPAVAFIVAIAVATGYFVWSNVYLNDPGNFSYPFQVLTRDSTISTDDWRIYTNAEYGFGISYPPALTGSFNDSQNTLTLGDSPGGAEFTGMQVSVEENPESLSPQAWWNAHPDYDQAYLVENIQGSVSIKAFSPDQRVHDIYVFVPRDNLVYEFYWRTLNNNLAERILSTFYLFELPDAAISDPVADWSTYKSSQHGFELKYPDMVSVVVQQDASVRFTEKDAPAVGLPAVLIHSMEVSSVSQLWLNDVLPNYSLDRESEVVLDGRTATTAAGRGEFANHILYIIPKNSGTVALLEVSNSELGQGILGTFKWVR